MPRVGVSKLTSNPIIRDVRSQHLQIIAVVELVHEVSSDFDCMCARRLKVTTARMPQVIVCPT